MQIGLQLFGLVHGLASLELRGFFPDDAIAHVSWVDGISALVGHRDHAALTDCWCGLPLIDSPWASVNGCSPR